MLQSQKTSVYRFNHELPPFLPLAVRSCGDYIMSPQSQLEPPMQKWFSEVFWSEEGSGEFLLEKQWVQVRDSAIFYLLPGEIHDIRPVSRRWKYQWLTLDHQQSPLWLEAMGFTKRPLPANRCPGHLFEKLREAMRKGTLRDDREAANHAHAILIAAIEGSLTPFTKRRASWVEECRQRIDDGYADPQLNVEAIADQMGVHRATLFRAFVTTLGMTPSHYLQSRRLHHAMELLKQTDLPIKEVALSVGLTDANYLARLVRKVCGIPPLRFRAGYRQGRMDQS